MAEDANAAAATSQRLFLAICGSSISVQAGVVTSWPATQERFTVPPVTRPLQNPGVHDWGEAATTKVR